MERRGGGARKVSCYSVAENTHAFKDAEEKVGCQKAVTQIDTLPQRAVVGWENKSVIEHSKNRLALVGIMALLFLFFWSSVFD